MPSRVPFVAERQREHAGKDHDALRGFIDRAVKQKLAGAGPAAGKRKQTPGKKPAGSRPGGGARRELEQLKKDACEHCGKKHAGECRYKPGSKTALKAEARALKAAAELSEKESGEDSGVDGEESDENYSRVCSLSHTSRARTPSQAQLFIAKSARTAYPDTQAEVSVSNSREDVVRIHPRQAKLQGTTFCAAAIEGRKAHLHLAAPWTRRRAGRGIPGSKAPVRHAAFREVSACHLVQLARRTGIPEGRIRRVDVEQKRQGRGHHSGSHSRR